MSNPHDAQKSLFTKILVVTHRQLERPLLAVARLLSATCLDVKTSLEIHQKDTIYLQRIV